MIQRTYRCRHLETKELAKHSTVHLKTVPRDENSTTYEWDIAMDLCVLCAGFTIGSFLGFPLYAHEKPET